MSKAAKTRPPEIEVPLPLPVAEFAERVFAPLWPALDGRPAHCSQKRISAPEPANWSGADLFANAGLLRSLRFGHSARRFMLETLRSRQPTSQPKRPNAHAFRLAFV